MGEMGKDIVSCGMLTIPSSLGIQNVDYSYYLATKSRRIVPEAVWECEKGGVGR